MSSEVLDRYVTPGTTADGDNTTARLQVYELATGVALAETTIPVLGVGGMPYAWLTFSFDDGAGNPVGGYVIVNRVFLPLFPAPAIGTPDPTMTAAGATPENQAIFIAPGEKWMRRFLTAMSFRAIQFTGSDAFLRVEVTSGLGLPL